MRPIRRYISISILVALALLVFLSIVGAFGNVERAVVLFNSTPMVLYWFFLFFILFAGFFVYKKLAYSPGLVACHLGLLLILGGAMYGSKKGHALTERFFNQKKIYHGYMRIFEGETINRVTDGEGRVLGMLPFSIKLEDYWTEFYEEEKPWKLAVETPPSRENSKIRHEEIEWNLNQEVIIPFTQVKLKVLQYLESARPKVPDGAVPTVKIWDKSGHQIALEAKIGASALVKNPPGKVEILKLFSHLQVQDGKVVNIPDSLANPAVKLEFVTDEGTRFHRYAFVKSPMMHDGDQDGLKVKFHLPKAIGAEPDPDSGLPAMEILMVGQGEKSWKGWIMGQSGGHPGGVSLASVMEAGEGQKKGIRTEHKYPILFLYKKQQMPRDYKSRLSVIDNGHIAVAQIIEVNYPLSYGGYHFYQHSYDPVRGAYTVLSVKSDSGLMVVYFGFFLTCLGLILLFWVKPARKYFERVKMYENSDSCNSAERSTNGN